MHSWLVTESGLKRSFRFGSLSELAAFFVVVARLADEHNHHPDCVIRNASVLDMTLVTHDAKNTVTTKDLELAALIDAIAPADVP